MNAASTSIFVRPCLSISAARAAKTGFRRFLPVSAAAAALVPFSAGAFPPAPSYMLYGMVRDQVGNRITAEGAQIVLLKGGKEIGRTPITSSLSLDHSYELNVRIDQNRTGTTLYTERAVPSEGSFSLVVEMNGSRFYPIEVSGNLTAGKGAERVRLDLNLGEDSDRDGLPDVWEQWQLYQAGYSAGAGGNWALDLITKDGDFDGDGQSNHKEYIAGTFAGDATEFFKLEIKENAAEKVRFEFYGITGKTYSIDRSTDNQTWERVPLSAVTAAAEPAAAYTATAAGVVSAWITPSAGAQKEFFRLSVR
jgi:hypothetical protein